MEAGEGIPLNYWPVSEYYYFYGLALARQIIMEKLCKFRKLSCRNISIEEVAFANAQEIINI